jgi:WD40 repeat protein
MLDEIVHNLESSNQVARIKKLVFCACTNNWSNEAQNLSTLKFTSYIQQLRDVNPSIVDLKYALYRIVIRLNHSTHYYNVANFLCEEMGKLYAAERSQAQPSIDGAVVDAKPELPSSRQIVFTANELQAGKVIQVEMQILAGEGQLLSRTLVTFPDADRLFAQYQEWQSHYRRLDPHQHRLTTNKAVSLVPERINECLDAGAMLQANLHQWYGSPGFETIKDRLATSVSQDAPLTMLMVCRSKALLRLPWNLVWQPLLDIYPETEVSLSLEPETAESFPGEERKIRILSLLATAQGIKLDRSKEYLDGLPDTESVFVVSPNYQEFVSQVSEQSWSVMFISSYISGYLPNHRLYLNHHDTIPIAELKYRLQAAVQRGLKVLILNCGDGLELASELADLQIPHTIVMREAVQDQVAQEFMKLMLKAFANGKSIDLSVREARGRLQAIEKVVPAASWLPIVCHPRYRPPAQWSELAVATPAVSGDIEQNLFWEGVEPTGILSVEPAALAALSNNKPILYNHLTLAQRIGGYFSEVYALAVSPDGKWLVSGHGDITHMDDAIKVWQLSTGKMIHNLLGHSHWIYGLALTPDNETIISASLDGTVQWWQLLTGTKLAQSIDTQTGVNTIALTSDGKKVITGGNDALLKIWRFGDGALLNSCTGHAQNISCIAVHSPTQTIATGSSDYTIKLWDLEKAILKQTLQGHTGRISGLAITPDGTKLVSASYDRTLKIWDITTGNLLHTLSGHTKPVNCVAIAPDHRTIVSGSEDRTVNFWSITDGRLLHSLPSQDRAVLSIVISADGQTVVTGGYGEIQVWRMPKVTNPVPLAINS